MRNFLEGLLNGLAGPGITDAKGLTTLQSTLEPLDPADEVSVETTPHDPNEYVVIFRPMIRLSSGKLVYASNVKVAASVQL